MSGHKIFVTAAPALRFLVTGLVLPGDSESRGGYMASAIVRHPSPGLRIEETWQDALSLRAAGNDDVYYDRVFVPDDWVVEIRPIGVRAEGGRTRRQSLGADRRRRLSRRRPGRARGRLRIRRQPRAAVAGGADPGQLHIQQAIGSMQIQLDAARTVLRDVARDWARAEGEPPGAGSRIATAKYLATNAACTVTETALRVAGGFSLTHALPLERYFRDARAGLFAPPQDDLALGIAGRAALAETAQRARTAPARAA